MKETRTAQQIAEDNTRIVKAGKIGVDSGLVWVGDPCYFEKAVKKGIFKNWDKFGEKITPKSYHTDGYQQFKEGMLVHTPFGDGEYKVEVSKIDNKVREVRIKFF